MLTWIAKVLKGAREFCLAESALVGSAHIGAAVEPALVESLEPRRLFAAVQLIEVADVDASPVFPQIVDTTLKNPWGMVVTRTSTEIVAENGSGVATTYGIGSDGPIISSSPGVITIPTPDGTGQSLPTGVGANYNDF